MKILGFAIAALAFAGTANAYEGSCFEKNNPDLYSGHAATGTATAQKPGVGDSMRHSDHSTARTATSYDAWIRANPDLET